MLGSAWSQRQPERAAIAALGLAARTAWMQPLIAALVRGLQTGVTVPAYPLWHAPFVLLAAHASTRFLDRRLLGPTLSVVLGSLVTLGSMFLLSGTSLMDVAQWAQDAVYHGHTDSTALGPMLVIGVATAAMWRSGMTVEWSDREALWRSVRIGAVAVGVLMLVPNGDTTDGSRQLSTGALVLVACGFTALALQAALEQRNGPGPSGAPPMARSWPIAAGVAMLVLLAGSYVVALLLTPATVTQVLVALRPLLDILRRAVELVLFALAYVTIALLSPLFEALRSRAQPVDMAVEGMGAALEELSREAPEALGLPPTIRAILLGLSVCAAVAFLATLLRRAWRDGRLGDHGLRADEERESVWSTALLRHQLADLLSRRRATRDGARLLTLTPGGDYAVAIRRLYQEMLLAASDAGHPRGPGCTPDRYRLVLLSVMPGRQNELAVLTDAYARARYGDGGLAAEDVVRAQRAWQTLSQDLGRLASADDTP